MNTELHFTSKERPLAPLSMLREGEKGLIAGFNGGRGLVRRLNELGFTVNTVVKVLNANYGGPMIVLVKDSKVAIGRGAASKILVQVST
ncbi:MAG: FeoA family protein [Candidatus Odinarchaeia archaeon]